MHIIAVRSPVMEPGHCFMRKADDYEVLSGFDKSSFGGHLV